MNRKFLIRRTQLKKISKKLIEQMRRDTPERVKAFSFDWDDNILHMPTNIVMDFKTEEGWMPTTISTAAYSQLRDNTDFRVRKDSFDEFVGNKIFIKDVIKALEDKSFAPSFPSFKKSLILASPFSIISARGNSPSVFPEAIKKIIGYTFSDKELNDMIENINYIFPETKEHTIEDTIDFYLNHNEYHPVTSEEFMEKFGIKSSASSPEKSKLIALNDYVEKVVGGVKKLLPDQYTRLSIGFSDDDLGNINSAVNFIQDKLVDQYPDIDFSVYDTSSGDIQKIVIEKT